MRFSIKSLLLALFLLGGFLALMSNPTEPGANLVFNLTIALIVFSALGKCFSERRVWFGGFLICSSIYFLLLTGFLVSVSDLYPTKVLAFLSDAMLLGDENAERVLNVDMPLREFQFSSAFQDIQYDLDRARGVVPSESSKPPTEATKEQITAFCVTGHCMWTILFGIFGAMLAEFMNHSARTPEPKS